MDRDFDIKAFFVKKALYLKISAHFCVKGLHTPQCQKCHTRETLNLSTDADSSTDTKKILLVRQSLPKKNFFLCGNLTPFICKSFQIWDNFFPFLFPKDFGNLKSFNIGLWEVGVSKPLNEVNKWRKKIRKKNSFSCGDFTPFMNRSSQIWDLFFVTFLWGFWKS